MSLKAENEARLKLQPPRSVAVVHFSGTGGARLVARSFEEDLLQRGIQVTPKALDRSAASQHASDEDALADKAEALILVFAVHAFDAPDPVYRWVEEAHGGGRRTAVISVSAGGEPWPNTGCRQRVISALEGRGFVVNYEKMMVMPCNWVVAIPDGLAALLVRALPSKVALVLNHFLAGETRRRPGRMSRSRALISKLEKLGARRFGSRVEVSEACTACGWCERNCPVVNILLVNGKPVLGSDCVMCFRCVYGCPHGALKAHDFQVLRQGFSIPSAMKRMEGIEALPPEAYCKGPLWAGVLAYLGDRDGY